MHEEEEDHSRMEKEVNPDVPLTASSVSDPTRVSRDEVGDYVCAHGTAMDVHCCHCHSGFIFDMAHECPDTLADAAEMLWVVLANVSGGDWTKQSAEWQEAAARWRDRYFAVLSGLRSDSATGDAVSDHSASHRDGAFAGEDSDPKLAATSPPPAEARDWQPIATAPTGVEVLVHDEGAVLLAWLDAESGWWMDSAGAPGCQRIEPPPTEWMPLPPAPGRAPGRPEEPTS